MSCDLTTWTIDEVQDSLIENADFEEMGSVPKAKLFTAAAKRWLILRPNSASHLGNSLTLNAQYVNEMLQRALAFIQSNSAGDGVRFLTTNGWTCR